jgi:hypothetical protein
MKSLSLGLAIFMIVAGLGLAFAGFLLGMKNGHVVCCYTDMLITPKLSEALDELGVTDEQLVTYLAKRDGRFELAQASEQDREQMAFLMAQYLTPAARDLYTRKIMRGMNLGLIGGGIVCVGGVFFLLQTVLSRRLHRELAAVGSERGQSSSA